MQKLSLPAFDYKIQHSAQGYYIFDIVRKKYVRLTVEEWTRQHFVHYLIDQLAYPKSLIRLERGLRYNDRQPRPDIVVYTKIGQPWMLVECKAPHVAIDAKVWYQAACYNFYLQVQLLVITNGIKHYCWQIDHATLSCKLLPVIPSIEYAYGIGCMAKQVKE